MAPSRMSQHIRAAPALSCCTKIENGRTLNRDRPLSWGDVWLVGDTGIEPVTSSV